MKLFLHKLWYAKSTLAIRWETILCKILIMRLGCENHRTDFHRKNCKMKTLFHIQMRLCLRNAKSWFRTMSTCEEYLVYHPRYKPRRRWPEPIRISLISAQHDSEQTGSLWQSKIPWLLIACSVRSMQKLFIKHFHCWGI